MFIDRPDSQTLRQGDIIGGAFYPHVKLENIRLIGNPTNPTLSPGTPIDLSATVVEKIRHSAIMEVEYKYCIILSQCCDIERRNNNLNIPAFVMAPLEEIPFNIGNNPEKLQRLRLNELPDYANLFFIPTTPPLQNDFVINFNKVFSAPRSDFQLVLSKKILQMMDAERVTFKLKLSYHFSRPTEDEISANLYPRD